MMKEPAAEGGSGEEEEEEEEEGRLVLMPLVNGESVLSSSIGRRG